MNTTKKILFAVLLVFVFSAVMAVAMAAEHKNETTDAPKAVKATAETNNTFVTCMKSAVELKQTSYAAAKETRKACLEVATSSNTSDAKKEAGKTCSADFKKSMKEAKSVFHADKNECKKIKHTAWEGFKSNFQ